MFQKRFFVPCMLLACPILNVILSLALTSKFLDGFMQVGLNQLGI